MRMDEQVCHIPEYAAITVPGGWTGEVAIAADNSHSPSARNEYLARWRDWLEILVRDFRQVPEARILKTSTTVDVVEARVELGITGCSLRVVCKSQKPKSIKDRVTAPFRPSEARRSFDAATRLLRAQIGTAVPYCRIERKSPPQSWLISEHVGEVMDLDAFVLLSLPRLQPEMHSKRKAIIRELARVLHQLKAGGLYHRDTKASNFLLADALNNPQFLIVDVDGLARWRPWKSEWRPIVRLAASLLHYGAVTRSDRIHFLREYLKKNGQDESSWRALQGTIHRQAQEYARQSHHRKSGKIDRYLGDAVPGSA